MGSLHDHIGPTFVAEVGDVFDETGEETVLVVVTVAVDAEVEAVGVAPLE